jgi:DNA-binding transcriptional regulator YhcF (GntR family)
MNNMTRQQTTTRKKVKVVGRETYIKQDTGEIKEMQVIDIEERDFNFHKVWLQHILNSIDLIGNQKTKLAFWIIENLNSENQLIMTQRKISDKTGISLDTVRLTMKALMESNFLVKINSGAYMVNPDVLFKGGKSERANILLQYHAHQAEKEETVKPETPSAPPPRSEEGTLHDRKAS